jgi:hypothetical protein
MAGSGDSLSSSMSLDSTDFKTGLAQANRELRLLDSEFKASVASLGDWSKSSDGLEQRIDMLTKSFDVQSKRVEAVRAEYERVAAEKGENSRAAQEMQIQLNRETEKLGSLSYKLEEANNGLKALSASSDNSGKYLEDLSRKQKLVESEFEKTVAGMDDWKSSSEGLQARISSLNEVIELQTKKNSELYKTMLELDDGSEENAKAVDEATIAFNKAETELEKLKKELQKSEEALDGMGNESNDTSKEVDKVGDASKKSEKEAKKFGDTLKDLGKGVGNTLAGVGKAVAAVGAASVGAVTGLTAMVMKSADVAGGLVDLSAQTGLTITQIQELDYVGTLLGLDVETITKSMAKFTNVIEGANSGVGPMAEDMATLGVSVTDSNGALRDSNDVYFEALNALGQLENETQKEIIAQNLFGKSYQELIPLINTSAEEMDALKAEAHAMGAVMEEDAVNGLESFGDELESLKMGAKGMMGTISAAMLPTFQGMTGMAKGWMGQLAGILSGADGDMSKIGPQLGELLGTIFTDLAGKAPGMVELGLGMIQGLMAALLAAMPELIPAAIGIVTTLIEGISSMAVQLLEAAPELIMQLVNGLADALPDVVKSGTDVVLSLVAGIGQLLPKLIPAAVRMVVTIINGISQALPQLMTMIADIIPQVVITLIENLPLLIGASLEMIAALVDGLVQALPVLIGYIPEIIIAIVGALVQAFPMIINSGKGIIESLINGIKSLFSALRGSGSDSIKNVVDGIGTWLSTMSSKGRELMTKLIDGLKGSFSNLVQLGKDIVDGIWEGIKNAWGNLVSGFTDLLRGLFNSGQAEIDAHSPSRVWAKGIGAPMAEGIGVGFLRGMGAVENQMKWAINGLIPAMGVISGDNVSIGFNGQTKANERALGPVSIRVESPQPLDYELIAQLVARKINGSFA